MADPTPIEQALGATRETLDRLAVRPHLAPVNPGPGLSDEDRHQMTASRSARTLEMFPARFRAARPTHPLVKAWVDHVLQGGTDSLVLLGPVGVGKTFEAFGALGALVERQAQQRDRLGIRVFAVPDLLEELRPSRSDADRHRTFDLATKSDLVLFDDLAVAKSTDWTAEMLFRILDHRYAWMLPSVITCNLPLESSKDEPTVTSALGERLASRLAGMGAVVVMDGPDRRRSR